MNDISKIGLLKRQVRDVQSVAGNVQHLVRRLVDGRESDGGIMGKLANSLARARVCHPAWKWWRRGNGNKEGRVFPRFHALPYFGERRPARTNVRFIRPEPRRPGDIHQKRTKP